MAKVEEMRLETLLERKVMDRLNRKYQAFERGMVAVATLMR